MKWSVQFVWLTSLFLICLVGKAQTPTWQWAKSEGLLEGSRTTSHNKIGEVDSQGNAYLIGNFTGTVQLGNNTLFSGNKIGSFLMKYNPCGEVVWVKSITAPNNAIGGYIYIDHNDELLLCLTFEGAGIATFDGTAIQTQSTLSRCIIKCTNEGQYIWHTLMAATVLNHTIFSDKDGSVYLYAKLTGNTQFGNTIYEVQGNNTFALIKYNALGIFNQISLFITTGDCTAGPALVASNGDIYLSGMYTGTITIGTTTLQNDSFNSSFVAVLKKNGDKILKKIDIGETSERISALAIDETTNDLYIGGDNIKQVSTGYSDDRAFIAKYNSAMEKQWEKREDFGKVIGIYVGNNGKVYLAYGTNFQYVIIYDFTNTNIKLCEYDTNGNVQWQKNVGSVSDASDFNVFAMKNLSSLHYFGNLSNTFNQNYHFKFDDISLTNPKNPAGKSYYFVAKMQIADIVKANAGEDITLCNQAQGQIGSPALPKYSYSWLPVVGLSNPNIANPIVSLENITDAPIVRQYIVKASDITCPNAPLSKYDTVNVTVLPTYKALQIFTGSTVVCPNTRDTKYWVNANANYDFEWNISGGNIESGQGTDTIRVAWQGTNPDAWVEVKAKLKIYGCETTFRLPIVVDKLLKPATPVGETAFCVEPDKIFTYKTSLLNSGSTYLWKTDDNTAIFVSANNQSEVQIRWTTAGAKKLWVTETNQTPCIGGSDVLDINVFSLPAPLNIQGANVIPAFASRVRYEVQASIGSSYQWILTQGGRIVDGQGSPVIHIDWEQEGEYLLSVQETNAQGCVGKPYEIRIKVVAFLPSNVISPNHDGKNDTWFLEYIDNFPNHKIQIFDRVGKEVYRSTAYKNDWEAENLPADVYFYVLTLNPKLKPIKGTITVLK